MSEDDIPYDTLQKHAENHLNLKVGEFEHLEVEKLRGSLWSVRITIPADETSDEDFYTVRVCEECGNTQSMNFQAYKKNHPQEAKRMLKKARQEQADDYVETGEKPVSDELLKNRLESKYLIWNNSECERKHPPQA